jgi:hypothetical protein
VNVLERAIGLLIFVGALACGLHAQTPPSAVSSAVGESGGWPPSVDARMVAWMAHDAAASKDGSKIRDLLELASEWKASSEWTEDGADLAETSASTPQIDETTRAVQAAAHRDQLDAMAEVLDALVQMKVAVPAETLRELAPEFGNDVAVLLSKMPEEQRETLSFEFYRKEGPNYGGLQYVSAAILALHPLPGFAADLLSHVEVIATADIVLPGEAGGGSSGGCRFRSSVFLGRGAWPRIGQYQLVTEHAEGDVELVDGSHPVFARRFEQPYYVRPSSPLLGSQERLEFIAEMLGISAEEIPWKTAMTTTIEFESNAQTERALRDFVEQQREMQRQTVVALAAVNLLTPGEVQTALPRLMLKVNDFRGDGAEPLDDGWELAAGVKFPSGEF